MSPLLFLGVSLAGGLGAALRFVLDGVVRTRFDGPVPKGTILINISGSFALGIITGLVASSFLPESWLPILGTGFLGGYTTFSTASVETVRLVMARQWRASLLSGVGTLIGSVSAAAIGLWLATLI